MATIAALQPHLLQGRHPLPGLPDYTLSHILGDGMAAYTIWHGTAVPLTTSTLCWSAAGTDTAWLGLLDLARQLNLPTWHLTAPPACPWLGTVVLPPLYLHRDAAEWLADAERCYAYAILAHYATGN